MKGAKAVGNTDKFPRGIVSPMVAVPPTEELILANRAELEPWVVYNK